MKTHYVTDKQVTNYIVSKLDLYKSLDEFKEEVSENIASLDISIDTAQHKFFTRVLKKLEHFVI